MAYVYVPAFWGAFLQNLFSDRGFTSETKEHNYTNWVYFGQIFVKKKNTQFGQFWVLFLENGILMGGKLDKKFV